MSPALRTSLLLAGAVLGYALLMATNPARPSLRDGLRCLGRHRQLWALPAACGLAHAAFTLGVRVFEGAALPQAGPAFAPWAGWQGVDWRSSAVRAALPAAEGAAGVFNAAVTTFPLSALAAVLFLLNWRGYSWTLASALWRRFGAVRGGLAAAGLAGCAAAAALKPALFIGGLVRLNAWVGAGTLLRIGAAVDWLGFVFEYLLGVGLQVYLIALAFAWVRGLSFEPVGLRRFALRRGSLVAQWAAVVIVLSSVGINGPLAFVAAGGADVGSGGGDPGGSGSAAAILRGTEIARWLLAAVLLGFCSVQITLVFHNETLRRAWRDHFGLVRRHGSRVGWFVTAAALHFFALALGDDVLRHALGGERTLAGTVWGFLHAALWGALAGWLLASWVCLFRRLDTGRADAVELVQF